MFFIFKIKHYKSLILIVLITILSNCQLKDPIKGHGINFLENRSKKITINNSNKNDVINTLGNPHTKSIDDENLWFYFDRKLASGKMMKFGDMDLLENNVLVLNFDKYGIVKQKEFYSKVYTNFNSINRKSKILFETDQNWLTSNKFDTKQDKEV